MLPIAPIEILSSAIGYQFNDAGVVEIQIQIACEEQDTDMLLAPIDLSFNLEVGGYTQLGGGLVFANNEQFYEDINTNKG